MPAGTFRQVTTQTHEQRTNMERRVDIEIYGTFGEGEWAQARYLVHGITDVMWTNDLEQALAFLKSEIEADSPHGR